MAQIEVSGGEPSLLRAVYCDYIYSLATVYTVVIQREDMVALRLHATSLSSSDPIVDGSSAAPWRLLLQAAFFTRKEDRKTL